MGWTGVSKILWISYIPTLSLIFYPQVGPVKSWIYIYGVALQYPMRLIYMDGMRENNISVEELNLWQDPITPPSD
ncbi:hypothetical protein I7I48_10775 [Histoplasma ohiense]|nr:hypothetical protein I7I48_10775 [Histoplasma ohiense (nom. inval.)]